MTFEAGNKVNLERPGHQQKVTSIEELRAALEDVDCAERVLLAVKSRVGIMIKDAFKERGLAASHPGVIDPALLSKIIKGQTFSRPAVERVISHLILKDTQQD